MLAVKGLDRRWQRISTEIESDTCFQVLKNRDVARVSDRIAPDPEGASGARCQLFLHVRFGAEEFVLVDQFRASRNVIPRPTGSTDSARYEFRLRSVSVLWLRPQIRLVRPTASPIGLV